MQDSRLLRSYTIKHGYTGEMWILTTLGFQLYGWFHGIDVQHLLFNEHTHGHVSQGGLYISLWPLFEYYTHPL